MGDGNLGVEGATYKQYHMVQTKEISEGMIVSRTIGALVTSSFLPVGFSQLFDQLSQWQLYFTGIRKEAKLYKFEKKNYFSFS